MCRPEPWSTHLLVADEAAVTTLLFSCGNIAPFTLRITKHQTSIKKTSKISNIHQLNQVRSHLFCYRILRERLPSIFLIKKMSQCPNDQSVEPRTVWAFRIGLMIRFKHC